jgi:ATP-dependent Clp protease, protease subunit
LISGLKNAALTVWGLRYNLKAMSSRAIAKGWVVGLVGGSLVLGLALRLDQAGGEVVVGGGEVMEAAEAVEGGEFEARAEGARADGAKPRERREARRGEDREETAAEVVEEAEVGEGEEKEEASPEGASEESEGGEGEQGSEDKITTEEEQMRGELARLTLEKELLQARQAQREAARGESLARQTEQLEGMKRQIEELKARQELAELMRKEEQEKELAELRTLAERLTLEATVAKAEAETVVAELKTLESDYRTRLTTMDLELQVLAKEEETRQVAAAGPIYLKEPFDKKTKTLVISDRRIELNGPIASRLADHVSERINYFNNRDGEMPIFIVIDDSPGGSVMAGYKILKAMEGSEAPVYVVVKSFAASMAACITTLAERSYAYPNAILMHHQIAGFAGGNLTQTREWTEEMGEWWRRLAVPVADKMGITEEEFIKLMYEKRSTGDWQEFADVAVELKWVDQLVEQIHETATLKHPDFKGQRAAGQTVVPAAGDVGAVVVGEDLVEMTDERGRPFQYLPRLNPADVYWLHNPDGYYRVR